MDCFNNMNKTPRKREPNFTADEKALLAQLVKKRPMIESKLTDGKSVLRKKVAWNLVTEEFNCNAHVHKSDTATLKRAWDNLKATARRARANERSSLIRTGGGPGAPPPPPQQGAIISMVEEAAPHLVCEVKNSFDSYGTVLSLYENKETDEEEKMDNDCFVDISDIIQLDDSQNILAENNLFAEENPEPKNLTTISAMSTPKTIQFEQRKPSDYVRREAILRIKHLEAKEKIQQRILNTELEIQETKKRAAEMEEERNRNLLEISKLELIALKKRLGL